mmetsp:Transcript_108/g.397  ORF Transcript_108/g.397 Transcript_108/m.397 type:complete len:725 (-) Transcript_108:84-2258(-)|eukprot:CAMPEP_0117434918 /NCGR_PEP_ID=MMETSP0759-20121206/202_1 /TAXON_ID=63605 /ORGANISM="Percolomonas cosmopolitus, Strain WS" /LENGTH=724 /DNA_ID=CAMNT_0005226427 /DNA_START=184 /DNA_END=2358 /DNA_ORIENTATION=-
MFPPRSVEQDKSEMQNDTAPVVARSKILVTKNLEQTAPGKEKSVTTTTITTKMTQNHIPSSNQDASSAARTPKHVQIQEAPQTTPITTSTSQNSRKKKRRSISNILGRAQSAEKPHFRGRIAPSESSQDTFARGHPKFLPTAFKSPDRWKKMVLASPYQVEIISSNNVEDWSDVTHVLMEDDKRTGKIMYGMASLLPVINVQDVEIAHSIMRDDENDASFDFPQVSKWRVDERRKFLFCQLRVGCLPSVGGKKLVIISPIWIKILELTGGKCIKLKSKNDKRCVQCDIIILPEGINEKIVRKSQLAKCTTAVVSETLMSDVIENVSFESISEEAIFCATNADKILAAHEAIFEKIVAKELQPVKSAHNESTHTEVDEILTPPRTANTMDAPSSPLLDAPLQEHGNFSPDITEGVSVSSDLDATQKSSIDDEGDASKKDVVATNSEVGDQDLEETQLSEEIVDTQQSLTLNLPHAQQTQQEFTQPASWSPPKTFTQDIALNVPTSTLDHDDEPENFDSHSASSDEEEHYMRTQDFTTTGLSINIQKNESASPQEVIFTTQTSTSSASTVDSDIQGNQNADQSLPRINTKRKLVRNPPIGKNIRTTYLNKITTICGTDVNAINIESKIFELSESVEAYQRRMTRSLDIMLNDPAVKKSLSTRQDLRTILKLLQMSVPQKETRNAHNTKRKRGNSPAIMGGLSKSRTKKTKKFYNQSEELSQYGSPQ